MRKISVLAILIITLSAGSANAGLDALQNRLLELCRKALSHRQGPIASPAPKPEAIPWSFQRPSSEIDLAWNMRRSESGLQDNTLWVSSPYEILPPEMAQGLRDFLIFNSGKFALRNRVSDPQVIEVEFRPVSTSRDEYNLTVSKVSDLDFVVTPSAIEIVKDNNLFRIIDRHKPPFAVRRGDRLKIDLHNLTLMLHFIEDQTHLRFNFNYPLARLADVNAAGRIVLKGVEVPSDLQSSSSRFLYDLRMTTIIDGKGVRRYFLPGPDEVNHIWGLDQPNSTMKFRAQVDQEGIFYGRALANNQVLVNVSNYYAGANLTSHDYFSHMWGYYQLNKRGHFAPSAHAIREMFIIIDDTQAPEDLSTTAKSLLSAMEWHLEHMSTNLSDQEGHGWNSSEAASLRFAFSREFDRWRTTLSQCKDLMDKYKKVKAQSQAK